MRKLLDKFETWAYWHPVKFATCYLYIGVVVFTFICLDVGAPSQWGDDSAIDGDFSIGFLAIGLVVIWPLTLAAYLIAKLGALL